MLGSQPEVEVQPEATSLAAELHPATTASAARQEPRRHQLPPQPSSTKPADPPWPGPGDAAPPDSPDSPLPRPPPHPHVRNSAFALPASNAPAPDDAHDATAPSSLPAPNHQTSTSTPASPRHANGVYAAAHPGGGADAAPPAGPRVQSQEVFYYQGLHDVASVLLLVLGSERAAFPVLCRLVRCQLRDATRISLAPIMEVRRSWGVHVYDAGGRAVWRAGVACGAPTRREGARRMSSAWAHRGVHDPPQGPAQHA